tara:strand:- start:174 stop:347 length:174 start_codon:yes stop_codon:yes gene_type:complete
LKKIGFRENSLWFANPKSLSHQIVYGGGALFAQWLVNEPICKCQQCIFDKHSLNFAG